MHVAVLTPSYRPERAPAAKRMASWVRALKGRGHEVTVVTTAPHYPQRKIYPGFGTRALDERVEDGVRVVRLRPVIAPAGKLARRAWSELRNGIGLAFILLRVRPSVIVATTPPTVFAPIAWLTAQLAGTLLVLDVRDLYWEYARDLGGGFGRAASDLARFGVLWAARRCNLVVTTNERQRDFFVREGASREKALIASNGVDDALLDSLRPRECPSPPSTPLSVAYVGLLGIVQGIGVLADAAQLLPQTEWMFSVAGEGPERESIARRAANAKLSNFQLMGYVDEHEIVRILQESDVLYAQLRGVAASASAVPSKLFEYMAAGKPIVFGGTGAGADLVRRAEAGIVIPPDDPDALANALSALKDGDLRSRLGESGRRFAEANRRSTIVAELVERIEAIGADRWNEHPRSSGSAAAAGAASQIGEDDPAVE